MSRVNTNIPASASYVPVDARTNSLKTMLLPLSAQNPGRMITFKDYYGVASVSSLTVSTIGLNLIDDTSLNYSLSNASGAISFVADGLRSWRFLSLYNGDAVTAPLLVQPPVRYSFSNAFYSGSGNVNNIGTNTSIGAATTTFFSYNSTTGFITTSHFTGHFVQAPTLTNVVTIIMISRIVNGLGNSYYLDARTGLADGYMWNGATGPAWTGQGYYRDCVLTQMPANVPGFLQDSNWHHNVFIRPAFTDDLTFFSRFTQNESIGGDHGEIMVFTQALTYPEIVNNYNFFAARFGLRPVQFP